MPTPGRGRRSATSQHHLSQVRMTIVIRIGVECKSIGTAARFARRKLVAPNDPCRRTASERKNRAVCMKRSVAVWAPVRPALSLRIALNHPSAGVTASNLSKKGAPRLVPLPLLRPVAPPASFRRNYLAATTMISTLYCGDASLASTVARAGVLPGDTQASHTAFISWNVFMSVM